MTLADPTAATAEPRRGKGNSLPPATTRERIIYEASNLFARQGYHATTTRQIAQVVGVRQPSIFYHFASKSAIMQTLLSWDLDQAVPFVEALSAGGGSAAERLYRYLVRDAEHLIGSPYNLSGLYTEEVMGDPEFAPWARKRERLHAAVARIIEAGIDSGEFVPVSSFLLSEAISGIQVRTLMLFSGGRRGPASDVGDAIARFVLRGLLVDPSRLDEIARAEGAAAGHGGTFRRRSTARAGAPRRG